MITRPAISFAQMCFLVAIVVVNLQLHTSVHGTDQLSTGTSSKQAKHQAVSLIPYEQLTEESKAKISPVLDKPSIYRRLPITSIDVDPDMCLFLIRYPEVMVNIWQIMGVTRMTADRTGPFQLNTNDGAGATSDVELIYGTQNKNIYYAEGTYSGPLLNRKLKGRAVLIMQTKYSHGPNGKPQSTNSLDVFVKVENATAGLIAKTLNPIVGPTADHNFVETLKFVQRLNETTEQNGVGVQRMAYRLTNLDDQVRQKFIRVAGTVYERSSRQQAKQQQAQPIRRTSAANGMFSFSPSNNPLPVSASGPTNRHTSTGR